MNRWYETPCECCGRVNLWEPLLGSFRRDEDGRTFTLYRCTNQILKWDEQFGEYEEQCEGTLEVRDEPQNAGLPPGNWRP